MQGTESAQSENRPLIGFFPEKVLLVRLLKILFLKELNILKNEQVVNSASTFAIEAIKTTISYVI